MKEKPFNEFGAYYLIKALNRCSKETQREVKRELQKIANGLSKQNRQTEETT